MGIRDVTVLELEDLGDERGRSCPVFSGWLSDLFTVRDAHITTILPGFSRGNHFHAVRHEVLIVQFASPWSLYWDQGPDTEAVHRRFDGQGAVVVQIPPHVSHAVRNDGDALLYMVSLTNDSYDPATPDSFPRRVAPL